MTSVKSLFACIVFFVSGGFDRYDQKLINKRFSDEKTLLGRKNCFILIEKKSQGTPLRNFASVRQEPILLENFNTVFFESNKCETLSAR